MSPRISVLLPVYNGARFLSEALDSLLAQTEERFEVVAVDDGSSDATPDILAAYAARDPRIRPVHQTHAGIVAALNHGLTHVRAPYVARMDADDLCMPQRLRAQADDLDARPDIGLVACRADYGGDASVHGGFAAFVAWTNGLEHPEEIALNRFVESPLIHPTVAFRTELPRRHGGYRDGAFPEDYELWLRWLDAGVRMYRRPENLVVWRERPDRLSRQDSRYATDAFYAVKTTYLQRFLMRCAPTRPLIVWGAGRITRRRAERLTEVGLTITAYVDIDPAKIGNRIAGRPVLHPDMLPEPGACFVLSYVAARGAREHIAQALEARGYRLGEDYLPVG